MTDSEVTRSIVAPSRNPSPKGFPVFGKIFRLLVGIAFVAPILAAVLNWYLIEQVKGEPWSVGLGIGVFIALTAVMLVWMITQRLKRPLEELMTSLNRVADGQYEERFNKEGGKELAELADAFNNLTTSLLVAREAMVDRGRLPLSSLDAGAVAPAAAPESNCCCCCLPR